MLEALRLGCPAIGFSGHSYAPYDEAYCMSPAQTETYKEELCRLREEYAGRIRIYMGIEQDLYSTSPTAGYDYVIGSVHYLYRDGVYLPIDALSERPGSRQCRHTTAEIGMPLPRNTLLPFPESTNGLIVRW